jgi:hypothetical protein
MREHGRTRNHPCWEAGIPHAAHHFRHHWHHAGRFPRRGTYLAMLERYREELQGRRGEIDEELAWVGREIEALRSAPPAEGTESGEPNV